MSGREIENGTTIEGPLVGSDEDAVVEAFVVEDEDAIVVEVRDGTDDVEG